MELWIRSQDKKAFVYCKHLYIYEAYYEEKLWYVLATRVGNDEINLARFTTQDEAISCLDKIQKFVEERRNASVLICDLCQLPD